MAGGQSSQITVLTIERPSPYLIMSQMLQRKGTHNAETSCPSFFQDQGGK